MKLSVLMPAYNAEDWIEPAVRSVLMQGSNDTEIVVCDDGSTDGTRAILDTLAKHPSVRVVRQENRGQAGALNTAFANTRGTLISLLDADDVYLPGKLSTVIAEFEHRPSLGVFAHRLMPIHGRRRIEPPAIPVSAGGRWLRSVDMLGKGVKVPPASGLSFRRRVLADIFPLPEDLKARLDGFMFWGAALESNVLISREILGCYRLHAHNLTGVVEPSVESIDSYLDQQAAVVEALDRLLAERHSDQTFPTESSSDINQLRLARHILMDRPADTEVDFQEILESGTLAYRGIWKGIAKMPMPFAQAAVRFVFGGRSPWVQLRNVHWRLRDIRAPRRIRRWLSELESLSLDPPERLDD